MPAPEKARLVAQCKSLILSLKTRTWLRTSCGFPVCFEVPAVPVVYTRAPGRCPTDVSSRIAVRVLCAHVVLRTASCVSAALLDADEGRPPSCRPQREADAVFPRHPAEAASGNGLLRIHTDPYTMEFDFSLITSSLPLLLQGAVVTLEITILAVGLGLVFGLVAALAQLSRWTPLRVLAKIYVDFIRGTPLLVQIFIIYFALPVIIGQRIDPFVAAVAACSINSGAYVAEIFRAGIQSIDIGQMRAGLSLGMNWSQTMRYIILPQAFKRIIPPLGNEFIAMLKDSSLVSVIGFEELTRSGQLIISETYGSLEIWSAVAILYLIMTLSITRLVGYIEKRFRISDAR